MKCDKIRTRAQGDTLFFPNMLNNGEAEVCLKEDVDAAIAEKDAEIAELKAKLEDAKATAYAESVDAGMRERRLKRALFMAHSIKANFHWWWAYECLRLEKQMDEPRQWMIDRLTATQEACENSRKKCRAKAEEYK